MPQTLLAVAALLIFSFFALGQHRSGAAVDAGGVRAEMELAVTEAARERLLAVTRLAFDEADVGSPMLRTSVTGLATIAELGPDAGEADASGFDDVDDYDGHADTLTVLRGAEPVRFAVRYAVRYVRADDPRVAAGSRTLAKEVTVWATEADPLGGKPVEASLTHVLTPVWRTAHS